MKPQTVFNRMYCDYFMPSRLNEYHSLLEEILFQGYQACSVAGFWDQLKNQTVVAGEKYLILRHDIDTDLSTARLLWEIEKKLGVRSSYYFRLSTIDPSLMREIADAGGEAGYHYEELAAVAKQKGLKTKEQALREMPYIRKIFKQNITMLRNKTGLPLHIVASHGDFINRMLGIINLEILKDRDFRRDLGIELEVYDEDLMKHVVSYFSDTNYPLFWKPYHPLDSVRRGDQVIYILVHPRHWKTNVPVNTLDNLKRLWESVQYGLRKCVNSINAR